MPAAAPLLMHSLTLPTARQKLLCVSRAPCCPAHHMPLPPACGCAHTRTNLARRGRAACGAPHSPCARALVLTALLQVPVIAKALQQGFLNVGNGRDGFDDCIVGTDSSGSNGAVENNGTTKKVRRARTLLLHPCMPACKHSTAAHASARCLPTLADDPWPACTIRGP